MAAFFDRFSPPPSLQDLPILSYTARFSLDRISLGVDNIHHDVQISPSLRRAMDRLAFYAAARRTGTEDLLKTRGAAEWKKVQDAFNERCRQVLTAAVHKAKSNREIQIDYLAQASVAKLIRQCIDAQYEKIIETLEQQLRNYELSLSQDLSASVTIKEKLSRIRQHRRENIRALACELFDMAAEAEKEVAALREANFGREALLPDDFFSNPMVHAEKVNDDHFLLETYTLLGHRFEDPDSYERLITLLSDFLQKTDLAKRQADDTDDPERETGFDPSSYWMVVENVDVLFDASRTGAQIRQLPPGEQGRSQRRRLRRQQRTQRRLLRRLYGTFRRAGLIHRVCAGFEVNSLTPSFCPPLVPQQVLRYMVDPSSRKRTVAQLNRLKGFYGRSFSVSPIHRTMRHMRTLTKARKQERLLAFIRTLARYHRDATHHRQAKAAMDAIHLDLDERTIQLSRENRTLYDFLLPDEQGKEEQPIIGHVILKADVRGSTDLTYRMRTEGLNPASFFSLNLFDPITEILFDYDATKEFLEGDALILSIFEQHETPEGWYSVGRACCLAARILQLVRQSNAKSRKHQLPMLELGIGICYNDSPPAFLFDGNNRIMISPAVNRADRLSGCDRNLRKLIEQKKRPFGLYVFQSAVKSEAGDTAEDPFFRYNVNGIELNPRGFEKLRREINLLPMRFADSSEGAEPSHRFYAGKVPLVHGGYQLLVIREAPVFALEPETMLIRGKTADRYYEVCTVPRLMEKAETLLGP
jgi:hypothetical protein